MRPLLILGLTALLSSSCGAASLSSARMRTPALQAAPLWRLETPMAARVAALREDYAHFVADPLALVRCPEGISGQCFFQKHAWQGISRAIRQQPDPLEPDAGLLLVEGVDGLIGLVQAGVLEIHPWGAAFANLEPR